MLCFDDAASLCAGDDAETSPPKWQDSYYTSVTESRLTQVKKTHNALNTAASFAPVVLDVFVSPCAHTEMSRFLLTEGPIPILWKSVGVFH